MEKVAISEVEPGESETSIERRGLSDPLGTTDVAINRYRLAPGEGFPGGLHAHVDQEEIFLVVEGEATFETLDGETLDGEVVVKAGEAIRFAPGDFQTGRNDSDAETVAFALGAPRDSDDVRVPLPCPECGYDDLRPELSEGEEVLVCPDCNAEADAACPECGGTNVRAIIGEDGETPVGFCSDCGAESKP
jgi:uncharacterized cupin superfamily protein